MVLALVGLGAFLFGIGAGIVIVLIGVGKSFARGFWN